jgi:ParB/RepB/Spo0J family partition protein
MSCDILLRLIDPDPEQPRKHFDEASIIELAQSIQANGLAVPILVRPVGDRFVIVHGERRYRAAKSLGWETIPAEVRDIDADTAQWLALVENVQRSDLSPIEEAQAYQARLAQGMTQTALAERIGKTQSYIAQKLRLLKLPDPVAYYLNVGAITEGHARQLLRLRDIYGEDTVRELNVSGAISFDDQILTLCTAACIGPYEDCRIPVPAAKDYALHATAARALIEYVTRHNGKPPAWAIAATWFAMASIVERLSVAKLGQFIDSWQDETGQTFYWEHRPKIEALARRLDAATTLSECKAVGDEALALQNEVAEYHLRVTRASGLLLRSIKES